MGLLEAAGAVGSFLIEHADIVDDVVTAIEGGAPKDAVKAAIRGVKVQVTRDALEDELDAATKRRADNHGQRCYEAFFGPAAAAWASLPASVQTQWEAAADAARA